MPNVDFNKIDDYQLREILKQLSVAIGKVEQVLSSGELNIKADVTEDLATVTHKIPIRINNKTYYLLLQEG